MNRETLVTLARYQSWADALHWKTIHANPPLQNDPEVGKRLNHILSAYLMLQGLARGEGPNRPPDPHSQHHRGQNAARMREVGITPPMTDFIIWQALGRP